MGSYEINELPELDKDKLIEILTDELPVLRAKIVYHKAIFQTSSAFLDKHITP